MAAGVLSVLQLFLLLIVMNSLYYTRKEDDEL